jgi:hypothetical protein
MNLPLLLRRRSINTDSLGGSARLHDEGLVISRDINYDKEGRLLHRNRVASYWAPVEQYCEGRGRDGIDHVRVVRAYTTGLTSPSLIDNSL